MTSQWKRLTDKAAAVQGRRILDLFDDGRARTFSARLDDMLLPDQFVEGLRAISAVERLCGHLHPAT